MNERKRRYRDRLEMIQAMKETNPCTDCGGFFDAVAMDFDHVDEDKFKSISQLLKDDYSIRVIFEEIAKCELVCANCHRIRTAKRNPRSP